jgi:hypothetical protein
MVDPLNPTCDSNVKNGVPEALGGHKSLIFAGNVLY